MTDMTDDTSNPPPATVREFSGYGPCLTLGEFLARSPQSITFRDDRGRERRRGGQAVAFGRIHVEPCPSCLDHPRTHYPHGYMD